MLRALVTTRCSNNCKYCYVAYNKRKGIFKEATINPTFFTRVLEKLKPEWVCLGGGEPLQELEVTLKLIHEARKHNCRVEVTTSGIPVENLEKITSLVDHIQLSIGDNRVSSLEAINALHDSGCSFGFNILLSDNLIARLPEYLDCLVKFKPRQILLLLPRIFHLGKVLEYFKLMPLLIARYPSIVCFDCVTYTILNGGVCKPPREEYALLPDGSLIYCCTYPHVKPGDKCPDAEWYIKAMQNH